MCGLPVRTLCKDGPLPEFHGQACDERFSPFFPYLVACSRLFPRAKASTKLWARAFSYSQSWLFNIRNT